MTRNEDGIDGLLTLTRMVHDAAEARLGQLLRKERELRAALARLGADRRNGTSSGPDDAAARAGADLAWRRWVEARQATLNRELARHLAETEGARAEFAKAFGRYRAMQEVAETERRRRKSTDGSRDRA